MRWLLPNLNRKGSPNLGANWRVNLGVSPFPDEPLFRQEKPPSSELSGLAGFPV
jgi:hypothetical protein